MASIEWVRVVIDKGRLVEVKPSTTLVFSGGG